MDEIVRQEFEAALQAGAYAAAWRYSCRLTASADDARDLLQDSLAHALPRFVQLRDPVQFRSWLLSIVRTQFLMALRSKRLTVALETELVGQLAAEPDPAAELVLDGLRRLPAAQRELLELFYIEGLELAELGRVLHVPAIVARHRLHRARAALRRQIRPPARAAQLSGVTEEYP
jgi:RNA polymerase sigma-70 factor (ECF subfamily)